MTRFGVQLSARPCSNTLADPCPAPGLMVNSGDKHLLDWASSSVAPRVEPELSTPTCFGWTSRTPDPWMCPTLTPPHPPQGTSKSRKSCCTKASLTTVIHKGRRSTLSLTRYGTSQNACLNSWTLSRRKRQGYVGARCNHADGAFLGVASHDTSVHGASVRSTAHTASHDDAQAQQTTHPCANKHTNDFHGTGLPVRSYVAETTCSRFGMYSKPRVSSNGFCQKHVAQRCPETRVTC